MISNYLYTIGKYLSPAQRDEVLKEIEANLYDYLEENYGSKDYTGEEIEKAIKEMGHPRRVAEAYMNSPRYLIGPSYLDSYWLVIKIAVVGAAIGLAVSNIISMAEGTDFIQLFIKLIIQVWQSSLSTIGLITLIFIAINYYNPEKSNIKDGEWSLSILKKAPEPNESISRLELIIETFFICLGLGFINNSSVLIGVNWNNTIVIPTVNMEVFSSYLIWINLLLGSILIFNFYLIISGHWQRTTRILSIALDILSIGLFSLIALNPKTIDISMISGTSRNYDKIIYWSEKSLYIGLVVIIVVVGIDIYSHLKVLLKKNNSKA